MKAITAFLVERDGPPSPHEIVIVAGGLACWDGEKWMSTDRLNYYSSAARPITWPVLWWIPLLQDKDVL
jgi:hypothetical protein